MPINGFGLSGFRSFREYQEFPILEKINLIAGQNNAGKSNVLAFLQRAITGSNPIADETDLPFYRSDSSLRATFAFDLAQMPFESVVEGATNRFMPSEAGQHIRRLLTLRCLRRPNDQRNVWVPFRYQAGINPNWTIDIDAIRAGDSQDSEAIRPVRDLALAYTGSASSDFRANVAQVLGRLVEFPPRNQPSLMIPAFRQITTASSPISGTANGANLISILFELAHPERAQREIDLARWQSINNFVQEVLGDPTAQLEIPHTRNTINIQRGNQIYELHRLGTGIHELIIIAAACTGSSGAMIFLEEPEIHLHPSLQRQLIDYLDRKTDNQYIISTHSAAMLNHKTARIYHLLNSGSGTTVQASVTPDEIAHVANDLGFKASDLLQSNCIIWVEGPSDRVYLTHWLSLIAPTLREGVDFSVMFYGGRLLRRLTAKDPEIDEFISLKRLNRNLAILIDSDKTNRGQHINETKQRIVNEIGAGPGVAWVTSGRTIENYVPATLLHTAIREIHAKAQPLWDGKPYSDPMADAGKTRYDKIAVAEQACQSMSLSDLELRTDLKPNLVGLAAFVARANADRSPAQSVGQP